MAAALLAGMRSLVLASIGALLLALAGAAARAERGGRARAQTIVAGALARPGAALPKGVALEKGKGWMRVTVDTARGRTSNKIYVYQGTNGPLFGMSEPTVVAYANGTVVAFPAGMGVVVTRMKTVAGGRIESESVQTVDDLLGFEAVDRVGYDPATGAATHENLTRVSGKTAPTGPKQDLVLQKGLGPGLELYRQIVEPRTRPGQSK